jgi:hypothetical protein
MWLLLLFLYCNCFYTVFSSKESGLCNEDKICEKFTILDRNEPSIFILHAEGRLGNHLMAFAIVMALAKSLNIRYDISILTCMAIWVIERSKGGIQN